MEENTKESQELEKELFDTKFREKFNDSKEYIAHLEDSIENIVNAAKTFKSMDNFSKEEVKNFVNFIIDSFEDDSNE